MTIMHRTSPKATDKKERKNNINKTKVNYVFLVVNSSFCNDLENSIKKKRVRQIKKLLLKKKKDLSKVHNKIARKTMKNNTGSSEPLQRSEITDRKIPGQEVAF